MYDTVHLYSVPNEQFINRQYFIGTKPSPLVSYNNVRFTPEIVQSITLPNDAYIDQANMVKMNNRWYDIVSLESVTYEARTRNIGLAFNPVVTFLTPSTPLSGYWERTPTCQHRGARLNVADDTMKISRKVYLPKTFEGLYYIEICSKRDIVANEDSLSWYGMWGYSDDDYPSSPSEFGVPAGPDYFYPSHNQQFPPLGSLIENLADVTGIPSSSILSVCISPRCPWQYVDVPAGEGTASYIALKKGPGYVTAKQFSSGKYYHRIDGSYCDISADMTTSKTLTLTNFERYCGRISLVDERNNEIAQIPNEYFDSTNKLTYYCYGQSDVAGLYTVFKYGDIVNIITEGTLPWLGDSWQDYILQEQLYDRQELARNITAMREQRNIDILNSTSSAILTGAVGLAGGGEAIAIGAGLAQVGIGIATGLLQEQSQIKSMQKALKNKEGLIKATPTSNYSLGYGINYIQMSKLGGAHIKIETPANLTEADMNNYVKYQGWPCNKYVTLTPSTGFLKGNLFSDVSGGNAVEINELRRELAEGVIIIT